MISATSLGSVDKASELLPETLLFKVTPKKTLSLISQ